MHLSILKQMKVRLCAIVDTDHYDFTESGAHVQVSEHGVAVDEPIINLV